MRFPVSGDGAVNEQAAHEALGLNRNETFYVISRLDFLDGKPRAIHRSYLNPSHFPESFLDHDFEKESLLAIINSYGFRINTRETTLRARFPTQEEAFRLKIDPAQQPVLEAEQKLTAVHLATREMVTVEYMHACYLNWEYRIANRRNVRSVP